MPTWDELRAGGWMVVDLAHRRLAVYPNTNGVMVFAYQEGGGPVAYTAIDVREVTALLTAVDHAQRVAVDVVQGIDAAKATHALVERMRSAPWPSTT